MFPLLANLITVFRIVLVFVLLPLMCVSESEPEFANVLTFQIIFIVAAITDYLDGYIAKKYQQQTVFGKFFDPIADKLLVIITLFYICQCRLSATQGTFLFADTQMPKNFFTAVIMIIVIREFLVTGIRLVASNKEGVVISASFWGKAKTVFTFVAIICLFFGLYTSSTFACDANLKKWFGYLSNIGDICLLVSVVLTIVSGFDYFFKNYKIIRKNFAPE
ncbi:CDP-diacylglycerol--glycerol-3-phosphate 3-phosphatidyltransferase ['Elaeagnus angustifolia' witches'-broom phytoplasma]|uniref:CDP-diacylglycerol--glycerol-3-phosphate 3-phosphatidyltransferase n=1 Tax='Elaeagnus angustifolia' witches'-broom phytoplasma TaxID=1538355 RepID=A0ABS5V9A1_9MOLU|nr:CDP-diacylglycerol--glycerol-3-phosphate 3-phosphatidyltransferase ['Elaeagnus angustifolia' witches'-broom phytoplasma]MCX2955797.1 CDP-diacylglycerol--glycerol-3-phosphate 3-phosphatidyltransferase [Candidatus Phytoplasma australiense]